MFFLLNFLLSTIFTYFPTKDIVVATGHSGNSFIFLILILLTNLLILYHILLIWQVVTLKCVLVFLYVLWYKFIILIFKEEFKMSNFMKVSSESAPRVELHEN